MKKKKKIKGFTLIELLMVIVIVAIVTAVVLVIFNPTKRNAQAKDAQRLADVQAILSAVSKYRVDHNWQLPYCGSNEDNLLLNDGAYRWIASIAQGSVNFTDNTPGTPGENCRGAWLMDVEGTNAVNDECGNPETIYSTKGARSTTGLIGRAYNFDGEDDFLRHIEQSGDELDITDQLTLAAWIYPTAKSDMSYERGILSKRSWNNDNYHLSLGDYNTADDSRFGFLFYNNGFKEHYTDEQVGLNEWHHVVSTYDKPGETATIKLYIDGELVKTQTGSTDYSLAPNDAWFRIGAGVNTAYEPGGGPGFYFKGKIDEVGVFADVLSEDEIKEMYYFGLTGVGPSCDLEKALISEGYLTKIPQDPDEGTAENSGYMIEVSPSGGISIKAPYTSEYAEEMIEVGL